jgi:hypothetical protein
VVVSGGSLDPNCHTSLSLVKQLFGSTDLPSAWARVGLLARVG